MVFPFLAVQIDRKDCLYNSSNGAHTWHDQKREWKEQLCGAHNGFTVLPAELCLVRGVIVQMKSKE